MLLGLIENTNLMPAVEPKKDWLIRKAQMEMLADFAVPGKDALKILNDKPEILVEHSKILSY